MADSKRTLIAVVLVVALVAFTMYWGGSPVVPPPTPLPNMEGVVDNSRVTYDRVRSDLLVRASRALEAGDTKTAEALYREMVAKWPADPDSHSDLAACLFFKRDYEAAQAEYGRALALNPKSVRALYGLGCVAYKQQRYGAALELLEKALAIREKDYDCHRSLGLVYQATGDRAAAIVHYERAIELAATPGDADQVRKWVAELRR